jgi:hypothetical protein
MIDQLLQELKETWGYTTEELNDIREKMQEVAHAAFWFGCHEEDEQNGGFTSYGSPEDFE